MTKCIVDFINSRKVAWLDKKIKEGKQSEQALKEEAEIKYSAWKRFPPPS